MTNKIRSVKYFTNFTKDFAIAAHFYGQGVQQ